MKNKLISYLRKQARLDAIDIAGIIGGKAILTGSRLLDYSNFKKTNKLISNVMEHDDKMVDLLAGGLGYGAGGAGVGLGVHLLGKVVTPKKRKKKSLTKESSAAALVFPALSGLHLASTLYDRHKINKAEKEFLKEMAEDTKLFGKINTGGKLIGGLAAGAGIASLVSKIKEKLKSDKEED